MGEVTSMAVLDLMIKYPLVTNKKTILLIEYEQGECGDVINMLGETMYIVEQFRK